jgi:hypothetical protein
MENQQTQQSTQAHQAPEESRPQGATGQPQSARQQPASEQVCHCANCDIEFFWSPTIVRGQVYCCSGCAMGGPCNCDYSLYRSVTIFGVIHYE